MFIPSLKIKHYIWSFGATDLLYVFIRFMEMLWSYKKCQKIGVGRGLGRVRANNLLARITPDRMFGTGWSDLVKLEERRKV